MRVKTIMTMAAAAVFSFAALADDGHGNGNGFQSGVMGSSPNMSIGGVNSGGVPWVVKEGDASVSSSGHVKVSVKGLLIGPGAPANLVGTTATVTMVSASLVCNNAVEGTPLGVTPSPLSAAGNAEIDQMVTLPAGGCAAPEVLVRVFTTAQGPFIALSAVTPASEENRGH